MPKFLSDSARVSALADGLVKIEHEALWDDGKPVRRDVVLQATAAGQLADWIDAAAAPQGAARVEQRMPPDTFVVFVGGAEQAPNVHVHNLRDKTAPLGRTYAIGGMEPATARQVATALRAIAKQP